jgi:signal transduction histidine kinase
MKARLSVTGVAAVLGCGVLGCAGAVWLAAHQPFGRPTEPGPALTVLVGVSLVGSGLGAWRARPENRLGRIMVFTGFAWFAAQLTEARAPWLYTLGLVVQSVFIVGFVYLLLSFPSGRLPRLFDRGLVAVGAALTVGLELLAMLYGEGNGLRCPSCSDNLLRVFANNALAYGLLNLQRLLGGVLVIIVIGRLVRRWLRASKAERRAVAPVLVAGCATLAALTWDIVEDLTGNPFGALPASVFQYTFATVPIAVLIVFLQRRLARGMVAGLVVELGRPSASVDLCEALARALGDPSLELAFWFPAENCYVDGDGAMVELPDDATRRGSTFVERDGQPVAVLLHDPVLDHNSELVRSVCAAANLALENERLQAELRAQLIELQASRARLVEATDTERRRIERDLHDGTQQRLVSIAMSLGLLEAKLPEQASAVQPLVREARQALASALEELRQLTHGINPPLLAERGLAAALDELCRRAALPAHLTVKIDRRLAGQVESDAYFMASEALTNASKHAHATMVKMAASYDGQCLTMEVADDGVGGATTAGGSGLRGLGDRVEALGGRFTVSSLAGRGTILRAEIPCE